MIIRTLSNFNTKKCKVMHISKKNSSVDYFMDGTKLESVNVERDLGVLISNDLKVSSQCLKASNTANKRLGMIKRTFTSRNSSVIIPLYKSIVRPHLEYCVQTWRPYLKKDIAVLEKVQHRATKMITNATRLSYEERLKKFNLPSLELRRTRGDLIEMFKMYMDTIYINTNKIKSYKIIFKTCENGRFGNTTILS